MPESFSSQDFSYKIVFGFPAPYVEFGVDKLNDVEDFHTENGLSQSQNPALTVLCLPNSLDRHGEYGVNGVGVRESVTPRPCRQQNSGFGSGGDVRHKHPAMQWGEIEMILHRAVRASRPARPSLNPTCSSRSEGVNTAGAVN